MKRNNFIKALIGLPLILTQLSFKKEDKQPILKKIKDFNKTNITQEIAAELISIVAWNHLNEKRFANTFIIKQQYKDTEIIDGKRRGQMIRSEDQVIYPRKGEIITEENGVTIFSPTTLQTLRLFPDGDWTVTLDRSLLKTSEYEYISRHKETGKERIEYHTSSGHGLAQVKMISKYIELGFLKYSK